MQTPTLSAALHLSLSKRRWISLNPLYKLFFDVATPIFDVAAAPIVPAAACGYVDGDATAFSSLPAPQTPLYQPPLVGVWMVMPPLPPPLIQIYRILIVCIDLPLGVFVPPILGGLAAKLWPQNVVHVLLFGYLIFKCPRVISQETSLEWYVHYHSPTPMMNFSQSLRQYTRFFNLQMAMIVSGGKSSWYITRGSFKVEGSSLNASSCDEDPQTQHEVLELETYLLGGSHQI